MGEVVNLNTVAGTTYVMQARPARAAGGGRPAIPAGGYIVVDQANPGVPVAEMNAGDTLNLAGAGSANLIVRPNGDNVPLISATSANNTVDGARTTNPQTPLFRLTGGTVSVLAVPAQITTIATAPATRTQPARYTVTARDNMITNNAAAEVQTVSFSGRGNNGLSTNNGVRFEVGNGATARVVSRTDTRAAALPAGGTIPVNIGGTVTNNVQLFTVVGGNDNLENNRDRAALASGRAVTGVGAALNPNIPQDVRDAMAALQRGAGRPAGGGAPGGPGRPGGGAPGGPGRPGGGAPGGPGGGAPGGPGGGAPAQTPQQIVDTYLQDTLRPALQRQGLPPLMNTGPVEAVPLPRRPGVDTPIAMRVDEMAPDALRDALASVDPSARGNNPGQPNTGPVVMPTGIPGMGGPIQIG